ncbi:MAG: SIMPL domain-containing protein [Rhodobiaceae bacterium]|nr:SIMPL domain-containing protein [Rhodobiaceae bacterium]
MPHSTAKTPATERSQWLAMGLGALMALGLFTQTAKAEDIQRTITITGQGQVSVKPDIAIVESGVVTQAKTAAEALAANTEAMQAVFTTLKDLGIEDKDMRTSQFSVNAIHTRPERGEARRISGYQVSNLVSVTIRDLDRVGEVLDRVVSNGSNELRGIRFQVENPGPLMDGAREEAVKDALRKAKIYVAAAGVALGPVLTINEHGGGGRPQPMFARSMAMEGAADVPIAAGEQTLSTSVTLVIGLE